MSNKLHVSLGVFAHNEERTIDRLLKSIQAQKLVRAKVDDVIVVSSGSFDATNSIVSKWVRRDKRYRLILEPHRRGKSAAINLFLQEARTSVVVTISGDLTLHPEAIEEITQPFIYPDVGMVGAHPIPDNSAQSQIGEEVKLLWELHHRVSMINPKCGEMVAFRNIIRELPIQSAVDEATIEVLLKVVGYTVMYAPRSIVYNKAPINLRAYMTQRRRVYAGHQWVEHKYHYSVATMNYLLLARTLFKYIVEHPRQVPTALRLVSYELTARLLGILDYHVFNRNPYIWQMVER
jgi:poly-beta-1,6-N-acetyl-D-glucosamine synthase